MKINKEKFEALANLPDAEMWEEIGKIASRRGVTLPDTMPERQTMERIRKTLMGVEKISMTEAVRILQNYKKR